MKRKTSAKPGRLLTGMITVGTGLLLACSTFAHHSQSEFDPQLPVEIEGLISKLEWKSPHARLYVDVVAASGETEHWNFELPSPNTLMRRGWKRNTLQAGEYVTVIGYRARNFPTIAIGRQVLDQDGKAMFSGTINPE